MAKEYRDYIWKLLTDDVYWPVAATVTVAVTGMQKILSLRIVQQ